MIKSALEHVESRGSHISKFYFHRNLFHKKAYAFLLQLNFIKFCVVENFELLNVHFKNQKIFINIKFKNLSGWKKISKLHISLRTHKIKYNYDKRV